MRLTVTNVEVRKPGVFYIFVYGPFWLRWLIKKLVKNAEESFTVEDYKGRKCLRVTFTKSKGIGGLECTQQKS